MSSAAEIRAERRRQRILQNSDDRMKKIFGGQNYHEEHLKLNSTLDEGESVVCERTINPSSPSVSQSETLQPQDIPKLKESSPEPKTQSYKLTWLLWLFFGAIVRIIMATSMSYYLMDNALFVFALTFLSYFMTSSIGSQVDLGVVELMLKLANLSPIQLRRLKLCYFLVVEIFSFFFAYFAGFLLIDVLI